MSIQTVQAKTHWYFPIVLKRTYVRQLAKFKANVLLTQKDPVTIVQFINEYIENLPVDLRYAERPLMFKDLAITLSH
jgi:tetraacyldisaccharide-1-P 4'-kinase